MGNHGVHDNMAYLLGQWLAGPAYFLLAYSTVNTKPQAWCVIMAEYGEIEPLNVRRTTIIVRHGAVLSHLVA
jgi:hypothetical protein